MSKLFSTMLAVAVLLSVVMVAPVSPPATVEATVDGIVINDSSCSSVDFTVYFTREDDQQYPIQDSLFGILTLEETLYFDNILYEIPLGPNPSLTHSVTFAEQEPGTTIYIQVDHGFGEVVFDLQTFSYVCEGEAETVEEEAAPAPVPGCDTRLNIPANAVVGALTTPAALYWKPGDLVQPSTVLDAGTTAWALGVDATGEYTKIIWVCDYVWVPSSAIGPNYDAVWNGAPLPMDVVN